ncbi:hypothetical protein [Clostridium sp. CTA-6]
MNFLDEILKEMVKEYEKEKNKDQNYYGDELSSNITKIWNDIDDILAKNNNITIKEKENSKSNKINKDRVTTNSIAKGCDKVKVAMDNRKDLNKYDVVKIIEGDYKALSDKECKFLEYCKGMDKILLQLDELNPLYVNPEDIKLVRKAKEEYVKDIYNEIEKRKEKVTINIKDDILTVILNDGATWDVRFDKEDNLQKREMICYYLAKEQQYKNMFNKLIRSK